LIKNIKIKKNFKIRLDKFLKSLYTSLTQSFIEKNIRKKNILINNSKTAANYLVKINDNLNILNFHENIYKNKIVYKKNIIVPKNILKKFYESIIFQNNDFMIINKWSQIATQGGSKINISIDHILKKINPNYRLVHRLDKETSGLLIIAKNLKNAKFFSNLFNQKNITKLYLALCEGSPSLNQSQVNLDIRNKKLKFDNTLTNYKVLSTKGGISQILFNPKTGKTHQIRIVSKNLGSPIVGDKKYNNQPKFTRENLMLHAYGLIFFINNKKFQFTANLPDHFQTFIKKNKLKLSKGLDKIFNIF